MICRIQKQSRWLRTFATALVLVLLTSMKPEFTIAQDIDDPFGDTSVLSTPARSSESKPTRDEKRIEIIDDYQEELKTGTLEQRPVAVILGAAWCGWCRRFGRVVQKCDQNTALLS